VVALWIIGLIVLLVVAVGGWSYADLVRRSNGVAQAWARLDQDFRLRHNLIRRLVWAACGCREYGGYEKAALRAVIRAHAAAVIARCAGDHARILSGESTLDSALHTLFRLTHDDPAPGGDGFADLHEELAVIMVRLETSQLAHRIRVQYYNAAVRSGPRRRAAEVFQLALSGCRCQRRTRAQFAQQVVKAGG
jgi:hypothetical protein